LKNDCAACIGGGQQFSVNPARDCFVAKAPRNDIEIVFIVIANPAARDKLHEAISVITISPGIAGRTLFLNLELLGGEK
jgi:hypothetical protein